MEETIRETKEEEVSTLETKTGTGTLEIKTKERDSTVTRTTFNQQHSVQCPVVLSKVKVKGTYTDIFLEDIPQDICKTLMEISELREKLI